jgi:hypothetical protein
MLQANARTALTRISLAAVFFCLGVVPAQAQVTLRYKFKEGEQLHYDMQQKMDMQMKVGGNEIAMKIHQQMELTWTVTKVEPDGKALLTQRIERIKMNMDTPGGKVEYDSKDNKEPKGPIGEAVAPIFNALAGAEFTSTMDARGETSNVKIPEKLLEVIKSKLGGLPGMADMFSPESLKRMVNQGGLVLPKEPVTKGQTWTQKMDVKMPFGTMKVTNTMTYEGPAGSGDLQKVGIAPSVVMEADPTAPIKMSMKGSNGKGTALFDNAAGRLAEVNIAQDMQMAISAGDQDIAQNIRTNTTLKLKK